jgi:hypothetical protein
MNILAYDFGTGGIKASLYGANCTRSYVRRRTLTGKLGEWAKKEGI